MWMFFNPIGCLQLFQRYGQFLFLYEVNNEALALQNEDNCWGGGEMNFPKDRGNGNV